MNRSALTDVLEFTGGYYRPTFMRVFLDTSKSLKDLNALGDADLEAAYLHEYIHFVQDVSTVYGLNLIHVMTEYMKGAVAQIRSLPQGDFKAPVQPTPKAADNVHANYSFANVFAGDGKAMGGECKRVAIVHETVLTHGGDVRVEVVETTYAGRDGVEVKYRFGGFSVLESMAFEIEHACYGTPTPSRELPYLGARRLSELVLPSLLNVEDGLIALCDASLMHLNPGLAFLRTLERIRDERIELRSCWDVYAACWDGFDIQGRLSAQAANAVARLAEYFPAEEFKPVVNWLCDLVKDAHAFRSKALGFPALIASGGTIAQNRVLAHFMRSVGSPLVVNNVGEVTVMDPKGRGDIPEQMYVLGINQIQRVLRNMQHGCELLTPCQYRGQSTDYRCSSEPWTRIDEGSVCPFSQVWNSWGLTGYLPKSS
jgi:hypothetical protein